MILASLNGDSNIILIFLYINFHRSGSAVTSARLTGEDDSDYLTCYQW